MNDYHERQYEQCYESTRCLLDFVGDTAGDLRGQRILDVACGGGANVHHMLRRWRESSVTGVDLDDSLLEYAQSRVLPENVSRCEYKRANLFELPAIYGPAAFNVTTLMQTLQQFGPDEYPEVLRALMGVTRDWVFLSSLFTDKRMDVVAHLRDYVRFGEGSTEYLPYNTFCMDRFRRIATKLGAKEVIFRDFEITIDLTAPTEGGIGTFTAKLEDGRRLQFSGAIFMPWKFAALRLR
jgi:SAM-dependent methyltransferase